MSPCAWRIKLRKRLWPEGLSPRQLAVGGAALFLLSAVVTLIILLAGGRKPAEQLTESPAVKASSAGTMPMGLQDFLLEASRPAARPDVYLFRQRQTRWTEEQIRRYWVPPEELILDIVARENDRRIDRLLQEVP